MISSDHLFFLKHDDKLDDKVLKKKVICQSHLPLNECKFFQGSANNSTITHAKSNAKSHTDQQTEANLKQGRLNPDFSRKNPEESAVEAKRLAKKRKRNSIKNRKKAWKNVQRKRNLSKSFFVQSVYNLLCH